MTGCSGRRPPRDRLPQQLPQQGLVAVGVCPPICPHSGSAARVVHWRCARSRAARRQASGSGGYSSATAQAAQACVCSCVRRRWPAALLPGPAVLRCPRRFRRSAATAAARAGRQPDPGAVVTDFRCPRRRLVRRALWLRPQTWPRERLWLWPRPRELRGLWAIGARQQHSRGGSACACSAGSVLLACASAGRSDYGGLPCVTAPSEFLVHVQPLRDCCCGIVWPCHVCGRRCYEGLGNLE